MPEIQKLTPPALDVLNLGQIRAFVAPESRVVCDATESPAWWLWWNLLSLDAPTVAVLWASVFARSSGIRLSYTEYGVLALSVWLVYVFDRLLDVWRSNEPAALPARHQFCLRHSRGLATAVVLATITAPYVAARELPARESWSGLLLAGVVSVYMIAIHGKARFMRRFLPKEFIVGIIFSIGTTLALWSRGASFFRDGCGPWIAFALLCSLNCLSIECWEQPRREREQVPAPRLLIAWVNSHFKECALAMAIFTTAIALGHGTATASRQTLLAVSVGALSLLLIHARRGALSRSALRVLADAALVLPPLLFWLVQR
jgi:hypothetical protein